MKKAVKTKDKKILLLLAFLLLSTLCLLNLNSISLTQQIGENKNLEDVLVEGDKVQYENRNYSYSYWPNGFRSSSNNKAPSKLAFETGHYALSFDLENLKKVKIGSLKNAQNYLAALQSGPLAERQPEAGLKVELSVNGKVYTAVNSGSKTDSKSNAALNALMWESGKLFQHYDLNGLQFEDSVGEKLAYTGNLKIAVWPSTLTLTSSVTRLDQDGISLNGIKGKSYSVLDKGYQFPQKDINESEIFSFEVWYKEISSLPQKGKGNWLICKNRNELVDGCFGVWKDSRNIEFVMNIGGGRKNHFRLKDEKNKYRKNKWNHIVGVYDGNVMKFFINGTITSERKIGRQRKVSNGSMFLGVRADGWDKNNPVKGYYDEVRVWNRALSVNELKNIYKRKSSMTDKKGLIFEEGFNNGNPPTMKWNKASIKISLKSELGEWKVQKKIEENWQVGNTEKVTLFCPISSDRNAQVSGQVRYAKSQQFPIIYNSELSCYEAKIQKLKRGFKGGWNKITEYDDFNVAINYQGKNRTEIPFLLNLPNPANITGLVPLLCYEDGTPSGIPVQLSKNWHQGSYLRAYTLIPLKPGKNNYKLRIVYSFYGSLPSASHAQLSLSGYGGNQRWDQLALASGGESICFDMDMSLTTVAVTDLRLPFGRNGKNGKAWGWTDAGWGGDWLGVFDSQGKKLTFTEMKTAYLAHGPCLTDVRYKGAYGAQKVKVDAVVQHPRTDDYARTFQDLKYVFEDSLHTKNSYFLKKHPNMIDTVVAYGNKDGLIEEIEVPSGSKPGDFLLSPVKLKGKGPWWISFPGRTRTGAKKDWGIGYISLIIHEYKAFFTGKPEYNPYLQIKIGKVEGKGASLETTLIPPPHLKMFNKGDSVELKTKWLHLHRNISDYYGENKPYQQHLMHNPQSWKTTFREVTGNSLTLNVDGGEILNKIPVIIKALKNEVRLKIQGGLGYIPVRFEGLNSPIGYSVYRIVDGREVKLDQSVHGNDFWQTDRDTESGLYKITFNLPVNKQETSWVFKKDQ